MKLVTNNIVFLGVVIFLFNGCASDSSNKDTTNYSNGLSMIIGSWKPETFIEDPCREATTTFNSDGTNIIESGELVIVADFTIENLGNRYKLITTYISDNGKENCGGIPADLVQDNFLTTLYIEFSYDGNTFDAFTGLDGEDPMFTMIKNAD